MDLKNCLVVLISTWVKYWTQTTTERLAINILKKNLTVEPKPKYHWSWVRHIWRKWWRVISNQLVALIIIITQAATVLALETKIPKRKVNQSLILANDIPSKDAYSMASYGGNIRYSHRNDEQPSSSSLLRKDDSSSKYDEKSVTYGYYNTSSNNFYSKTMN